MHIMPNKPVHKLDYGLPQRKPSFIMEVIRAALLVIGTPLIVIGGILLRFGASSASEYLAPAVCFVTGVMSLAAANSLGKR
jgi:hypothetical protein